MPIRGVAGDSGSKPSISRVDRMGFIYSCMKQGMSYTDALREVNERFDIIESPATVTTPIMRVWSIGNNDGYPLEIIPNEGQSVSPKVSGEEWARSSSISGQYENVEIGVDEGIPGSDQTAVAVASGGKVVSTFGIIREGDDFVVRDEEGSILGKCRSKEKFMEILHLISEQRASERADCVSAENASRFDIIDME